MAFILSLWLFGRLLVSSVKSRTSYYRPVVKLIILAPNISALKKLLKLADDFSVEFEMKFNASKLCKLLVFSKHDEGVIEITFGGVTMRPSRCELHLGAHLGSTQ